MMISELLTYKFQNYENEVFLFLFLYSQPTYSVHLSKRRIQLSFLAVTLQFKVFHFSANELIIKIIDTNQ